MRPFHVLAFSALLGGTILAAPALAGVSDSKSDSKSDTASEAQAASVKAAFMNQSVDAGIRDAQAKRASGDFSGAIRVLSQLMLINADDGRVVAEYGKVLVQQGRTSEALDFLNRAVELSNNDWTLYSALGVAYDGSSDYANAQRAYDRALVIKPGEPAILNNYALSRAMAGDLTMAKTLIAQAVSNGKDDRLARNAKMIHALTPISPAKTAAAAKPLPLLAAKPSSKEALHANAVSKLAPTVASAPPRQLTSAEGKQIVMQAVPFDAKAGPVSKPRAAKPGSTKVAKQNDGIPALRLANDRQ